MKTLNVEDGKKGTLYVDSSPTTMFVDTISLIDEKFDKIKEKIEKTDKNCSNISKKLQKTEENAKILAENNKKIEKKIENVYGFLASEYISIELLRMRDYLINSKFLGTVKNRKLRKKLKKNNARDGGLKDLRQGVIEYKDTAILAAIQILTNAEEIDVFIRG